MLTPRLNQKPRQAQASMDRLQPDPTASERTPSRAPGMDRAHWERIAEESLARVFQATSAGLLAPGLRTEGAAASTAMADSSAGAPGQDPACRQGFRLTLAGSGTSFTPIIGACFHFQSLRQLTAASGRQLGLKAVIVVRGQVVLLTEPPAITRPVGGRWLPWPASTRTPQRWPAIAFPWAPEPARRTLLGMAELMPLPKDPPDPGARVGAPAQFPLWRR